MSTSPIESQELRLLAVYQSLTDYIERDDAADWSVVSAVNYTQGLTQSLLDVVYAGTPVPDRLIADVEDVANTYTDSLGE